MTVLEIAQSCARRLQLNAPATFIGSTDNNMILLQAMMLQTVNEIRASFPWPELQKEYLFELENGEAAYALPADFDRFQFETLWNRTQHWPLIGPLDGVEWQQYKSGLVTSYPRQRFRVKGWGIEQFFVDPTPGASEDEQECVFEYISQTAIKPKTWVASTSWTGLQYCSYNGYIFDRGSTGAATTGTTAPTPAVPNDGTIAWVLLTTPYATFVYDSDNVILDNQSIIDGACWRFKREIGLDYQQQKQDAEDELDNAKTRLSGAGVLSIQRRGYDSPMIGYWSYPIQNYNPPS